MPKIMVVPRLIEMILTKRLKIVNLGALRAAILNFVKGQIDLKLFFYDFFIMQHVEYIKLYEFYEVLCILIFARCQIDLKGSFIDNLTPCQKLGLSHD